MLRAAAARVGRGPSQAAALRGLATAPAPASDAAVGVGVGRARRRSDGDASGRLAASPRAHLPAPYAPAPPPTPQPATVKLLINGELVESKTSEWVEVQNPATQAVVSRLPLCTEGEFNAAVQVCAAGGAGRWCGLHSTSERCAAPPRQARAHARPPAHRSDPAPRQAAKDAFPKWRATPVPQRARVMLRLQHLINQHMDELAACITQEQGKTLADARGDVFRGLGALPAAALPPPAVGRGPAACMPRCCGGWAAARSAGDCRAALRGAGSHHPAALVAPCLPARCRGGRVRGGHCARDDGRVCGECVWRH